MSDIVAVVQHTFIHIPCQQLHDEETTQRQRSASAPPGLSHSHLDFANAKRQRRSGTFPSDEYQALTYGKQEEDAERDEASACSTHERPNTFSTDDEWEEEEDKMASSRASPRERKESKESQRMFESPVYPPQPMMTPVCTGDSQSEWVGDAFGKYLGFTQSCSQPNTPIFMSAPPTQSNESWGLPTSPTSASQSLETAGCEDNTTIMVRNLPDDWMQCVLVELMLRKGFAGRFDFVYLPMNFRSGKNFGYGFVNLRDHETALELAEKLNGCQQGLLLNPTVLHFTWSSCQGLDANIERYRNSPLMHRVVPSECKPALYDHRGGQAIFPSPTERISKPRIHWSARDLAPSNLIAAAFVSKVDSKAGYHAGGSKTSRAKKLAAWA